MTTFDDLLRRALIDTALLCLPIITVATAAGAAIALLQAATQVQEQTLSLLPKLICVGCAAAIVGPFAMNLCAQLFRDTVAQLPGLIAP